MYFSSVVYFLLLNWLKVLSTYQFPIKPQKSNLGAPKPEQLDDEIFLFGLAQARNTREVGIA